MKKLEMKDLTEAEKAYIAQLVQKAQAHADHPLSNSERNKIRETGRQQVEAQRAKAAKQAGKTARDNAKKRASAQTSDNSFSWSASVSNKYRGRA